MRGPREPLVDDSEIEQGGDYTAAKGALPMFCVTYVPYGEQSVPLEPQPYRENDDYYEEEYREEQDGPE